MSRPVYILGAGALGSLLGALISKHVPVHLQARAGHARAIRRQGGLRLRGLRAGVYPLRVDDRPHPPAPGALVLVTVKAFDLEDALRELAPRLDASHLVVVLQNGLGIRHLAARVLGRPVVRAVTFMAAATEAPGQVAFNAMGKTYFSSNGEVLELWERSGMPAVRADRIDTYVWRKLALNAVINPLSALLGVANGELLELRPLARGLVEEVVRVARLEGQILDVEETLAKVEASMQQTARNTSSMLQDMQAGRETEIDWISGAVVQLAEKHGVQAPLNRMLRDLVRFKARHSTILPPRPAAISS